jgi:hypothetical protein
MWAEVVAEAGRGLAPVSRRLLDGWRERGLAVRTAVAVGPAFWATQEIEDCPALLDTCAQLLEAETHAA